MLNRYIYSILIIFALSTLIRVNEASNILCMFTSSGKTQLTVFMAVANTLIERDHNVTIVTTIPIPPNSMNQKPFRHILLEQPKGTIKSIKDKIVEMGDTMLSKIRCMINLVFIFKMFLTVQKDALSQAKFQEFLQEDNHFDLMVLGYFNNDFLVGVAGHYRCPIAIISLSSPYGPLSRMIGNPEETTYVQFPLFGNNQPMSFVERLLNFIWSSLEPLLNVYSNWLMERFYKSIFPADFYPSFSDVIKNVSLVLCNHHFSEIPVRPLIPAVVEIGGIQVKDYPNPMPEEIQRFLDSSVNGSILFNVASTVRGTSLKPNQLRIVINVLSKLDQTVLFELEDNEAPPNISNISNILFRRNLPIDDILFHSSLQLFITDGRGPDIYAARTCGIPMVGIPLYGEEPYIVEDMTNKGYGVSVDIHSLSENSLKEAISKVLHSPLYKGNVNQFSRVFRDRPITARQTAAFWLEYVIRHRGALHMQSPLVSMDCFQKWNIDVIAVLWAAFFICKKLILITAYLARQCLDFRMELCRRPVKYKKI